LNRREKIEKFGIFRGSFLNPNQMADPTQPKQQKVDMTQAGSKSFDPDPSL